MPLTKNERTLRAKVAANSRWATERDRASATAPGRSSFMRRFEDQVDPDRQLSPDERAKRAENAKTAHFSSLALKSAVARRKNTKKGEAR